MSRPTPTPTPPLKGRGLSSRETSGRLDSPPLQGRGRGWGLSVERLDAMAEHARANRRNPAEPEIRLWSILSGSQLGGFKFRRQAAVGEAIADFLCPQKRLIVEVDGDSHVDLSADARRTAKLEALGYHVFRVTNADVKQNLDGVARALLDRLESLPDRGAPHPNPSPEGEALITPQGQEF